MKLIDWIVGHTPHAGKFGWSWAHHYLVTLLPGLLVAWLTVGWLGVAVSTFIATLYVQREIIQWKDDPPRTTLDSVDRIMDAVAPLLALAMLVAWVLAR